MTAVVPRKARRRRAGIPASRAEASSAACGKKKKKKDARASMSRAAKLRHHTIKTHNWSFGAQSYAPGHMAS